MTNTTRRRRRLARRYVVVAVALVTGAVLATGALNLRFTYDAERDALADLHGAEAETAAARIAGFMDDVDRQLEGARPRRGAAERREEFRRILFQVPAISDLRFIDEGGIERVVVSRVAPDALDSGNDRSSDEVFRAPSLDEPYYGPVRFRDGTEPHLLVSHRAHGGGAIVADVHLSVIRDVVAAIEVGERGEAFAVDPDGVLIAHPDLTLVLGRRDLSTLPQVRRATEAPSGDGITAHDLDGERVLTSFRVVESLGWAVFVQQPVAVAFDRVEDGIVRTGFVLVAAVVLAGTAASVLARRMVRPLSALHEGATRIGAGALDHRIDVRSGDELEDLAGEFNRMGDRLQASVDEVRDSRSRIVAAADHARRQLERDLHDGAQQHLVAIAMRVRMARRAVVDDSAAAPLLDEVHEDLQRAVVELRNLAHGIYPPLLASDGLQVALSTAAKMAAIPTTVKVDCDERYPQDVEAAIYFCCLEALQNAAKHAGDEAIAAIHVEDDGRTVTFTVSDTGAGFDTAATRTSDGLVNMTDRVGSLGGRLSVTSAPGDGTRVVGTIPLPASRSARSSALGKPP